MRVPGLCFVIWPLIIGTFIRISSFVIRFRSPLDSRICWNSADKLSTEQTSVGSLMTQASDHGQHCPFLNRTDSRCGSHFTLERLEHAFAFCFNQYNACPVYLEMLSERQIRRGEARERSLHLQTAEELGGRQASHEPNPLVELTIHAKRPAKILQRNVGPVVARISPAPSRAA
jgi:hypothetical protein